MGSPLLLKSTVDDIIEERAVQQDLWGQQDHENEFWYGILGEEFGEVGKAYIEAHFGGKPPERVRDELVQVAAVACAWIEAIDRRTVVEED